VRRPKHDDIDEIAVARCAAGTLHHTALTWAELKQVLQRLERWLTDAEIDRRIGARKGLVTSTRRRQGWPRTVPPPAAGALTEGDIRRILRRGPAARRAS
jgi:hypothetical protein